MTAKREGARHWVLGAWRSGNRVFTKSRITVSRSHEIANLRTGIARFSRREFCSPNGARYNSPGQRPGSGIAPKPLALKGQDTKEALCFIPPLQGGPSRATSTQGAALGCNIPPFQGLVPDVERPSCIWVILHSSRIISFSQGTGRRGIGCCGIGYWVTSGMRP